MGEFGLILIVRVAGVGVQIIQSPYLVTRFLSPRGEDQGEDAFQLPRNYKRDENPPSSLYYCKCRALDTVTYVASCAEVDVMM